MQKKLSRFSLKLALFLAPILAFCVAVPIAMSNYPMHFYDIEYAMYQHQKDYIFNNDDYNRVIITGDSKPKCAFYPKLLSDDTYNLSLGALTPIENYYYLKEYLESREAPETAIISFNSFHYMYAGKFWSGSVYFHRLSDDELSDIYNTALQYEDSKEILTNFEKERFEYKYYSVKKYGKTFINALLKERYKKNMNMYNNMFNTKGYVSVGKADYCDEVGAESMNSSFKPLDISDAYIRKTIDMCLNYGIKVIIEVVPMNKATYEACTESYLSGYSDYMKKLQEDYPQITINTDLYYYDNEYFGDAAHFNLKGTEKYSKYIKEKYPDVFEK